MKRFTFYLLAALITFVTGSFTVLIFVNSPPDKANQNTKFEVTEVNGKWKFIPVKEFSLKKESSFINGSDEEPKKEKSEILSCLDKTISQVWGLLKKDQYFREQSGLLFEEKICVDVFEVLEFDLNVDGQKEVILRGKTFSICGATGNCGFWIFEKKGKKYRKILSTSDYVDVSEMGEQIKKSRTKRYFDIVTKGHLSVSNTRFSTYKYDGRRYIERKCIVDAYVGGAPDNPQWESISCKKFYNKWENEN